MGDGLLLRQVLIPRHALTLFLHVRNERHHWLMKLKAEGPSTSMLYEALATHTPRRHTNMKPISIRPLLSHPALCRGFFHTRAFVRPCVAAQTRSYARQSPSAPTLEVFNSHAKYMQKERAASNVEESRQVDYMRDEVATRLTERLLVRHKFLVFNTLL